MRGVDYTLETIATFLAHGYPHLEGKLEPLDPVWHREILLSLTELVCRALGREYPMSSRATRLAIAREAVYLSGLTIARHC